MRDDEAVGQMREVGGQIVGQAVGEIVLLGVAAEVGERQHDDRQARRVGELLVRDGGDGGGAGGGGGANLCQPNHPAAIRTASERGGERRPAQGLAARLRAAAGGALPAAPGFRA